MSKRLAVFLIALVSCVNALGLSWTVNGVGASYTGGRSYSVTLPAGTTTANVVCDPSGISGDHTYMRYTFNGALALADVPGWWSVPQDQPQTYWTGDGTWEWRPPQTMSKTISGFSGSFRVIVEGENYDWTQSYVLNVNVPAIPTRTLTISAPSSVYAGQSFSVPVSASTTASDGEQIGFFHGEYSTDGGASWTGFCYDANVGTSATRSATITAGGVGSSVLVRTRIAFRGGGSGDVDYANNAIDWGGSWSAWQIPPAKIATISVVNRAPSTPVLTPSSTSIAFGQPVTFTYSASDPDNNLAYANLWITSAGLGQWNWVLSNGTIVAGNGQYSATNAVATASGGGAVSGSVVYRHAAAAGSLSVSLGAIDTVGAATNTPASTITITKATPTGTFAGRSFNSGGASYSVQAADLNAVFSNPYSSSVTAPTGAPSYSIVAGGSGAVTAGTALAAGGTYTVRATYAGDGNYNAATVDAVWTVGKANQSTVTISPAAQTVAVGSTVNFSVSGGGVGGYSWGGSSGATGSGTSKSVTFPTTGTYTVTVSSPGDANYNPSNTATATIAVATPTAATFSVAPTSFTYTGSAQGPTITPTPAAATFTTSGTATATNAGTYSVTANGSGLYAGTSGSVSWTINKATATVTLGSLNQGYTGSPISVVATTSPAGLPVSITYNGSSTPPTALGSYAVAATINDANYQGSASGTLVIGQGGASVSLSNLNQTANGSPRSVTVTTNPSGLPVVVTYDGSTSAPSAAGFYAVVATINDPNFQGSASGTLTIANTAAATGGTVTTSGGYTIHTFTGSGTFTVNSPITVDAVVVAGGGGGGTQHAGGGGAGGVVVASSVSISPGTYNVLVGSGGSGNTGYNAFSTGYNGQPGGNSNVFNLWAVGGGAGGNPAGTGGSGGGSSYPNPDQGGDGTAGQGNPGNRSSTGDTVNGGGGGGAGGAGSGINGGAALSTWAGTFAGGGGGGFAGGAGGGAGAGAGGAGGANGGHATANTGSGGGGGGNFEGKGGNGGSGIVVIRYAAQNHAPSRLVLSLSGTTLSYNSTYQHYVLWSENPVTFTSTLQDTEGGLVDHTLRYQQVTGANPIDAQWVLMGDHTPSNPYNSTKQATITIQTPGRWDFNSYGHDGLVSHPGDSLTVWVYGDTNAANFISQTINGQAITGSTLTLGSGDAGGVGTAVIKMRNTGTKPWQKVDTRFGTPHRLRAIGPQPTAWGGTAGLTREMTEDQVDPQSFPGDNDTATFNFTFPIPQTPGQYVYQWKMVEDGVPGDPFFEAATPMLTITVVDTTPPTVPQYTASPVSARTDTSFALAWNASTDNVAVTGYEASISRADQPGQVIQTLTIGASVTTATFTGLQQDTEYVAKVRARDAAGNWSAWTTGQSVRTRLAPLGDYDGDGMLNGWEEDNGLNPKSASDAFLDGDGDGFSNIAEHNLGKNPAVYDAGTSTLGNTIPGGWTIADARPTVAVGATKGELNVDKSGALTYSVPIWVTPGTAGMQPQVSLNYSSQAGVGIAGFGWSLGGVSAITRGPQTKIIDGRNKGVTLTADDRFYLDGQRLLAISGTYGYANTEYRTELDSISKIVSYGSRGSGPAYFKVWTKAGLVIEFGNTDDSAFDAWGKSEVMSWHVNKISDTKGNYMSFEYTEDAASGIHRIARINYTGNGTVAPYASVRFEYENRSDWSSGFVAGSPVSNLVRLKRIKSCFGESVARTYTLDYLERQFTGRSLLASLTEAGADGKSYSPLNFSYNDNDAGWQENNDFLPPYFLADNANGGKPAGSGFVDLDGDGRVDFVAKRENSGGTVWANYAKRNTGSGWVDAPAYLLPFRLANQDQADDQGSRFVDLNGDGLIDFVWSKQGTGGENQGSGAVLNTGSGWQPASQWTPPAPIARDGSGHRSGRFLDVDGDGRVDYVAFFGTAGYKVWVYLNNGNGWTFDAGYSSISIPTSDDNLGNYRPRFIDLNGDGLVDIAAHFLAADGIHLTQAWLNTGSGWGTAASFQPPEILDSSEQKAAGSEFADVNGDGLPDVVWYREISGGMRRGVAINTGTQFVQSTGYFDAFAPPAPLSRDGAYNAGSAFIDVNADGIADLLTCRQFTGAEPIQREVQFGTGHNWAWAGTGHAAGLPYLLLQGTTNAGVAQVGADFIDLNSDGAIDVLWYRRHSDNSTFGSAQLNKARPTADRMSSVSNGLGVVVNVTYDSLMNPAVYTKAANNDDLADTYTDTTERAKVLNVIGPMYVVRVVSHEAGGGVWHNFEYSYANLRTHRDRGSLGFGRMKVKNNTTDVRTITTFRQDYPFVGQASYAKVTRVNDAGPLLSESTTTWVQKQLNTGAAYPSRLLYASTVVEKTYDVGTQSNYLTTTTTSGVPDDYGNVGTITVSTSDGFTKTTTSTYFAADTTRWILGRLDTATVASTGPSGYTAVTRASSFTYDTDGLLKTESVQPGDFTYGVTTQYDYDAFGNKTKVWVINTDRSVDASGNYVLGGPTWRTTETGYDSNGRFPIWTKNALGHQENYTNYDQALGVLKSMTGANDLPTDWSYDGFGRKLLEVRADGTQTITTYKWVSGYLADAAYCAETESTGAAPARVIYDKYGRARWSQAINGDGKIVYQQTTYDSLGRVSGSSVPYFNDGSTVHWTSTTYDLLDRPLTVTTPDDENGTQTTSYAYSNFTTTATDPKGRVSETVKNSQGWTLTNTRNKNAAGSAPATTVTYSYDAIGNLLSTNAAGAVTTLTYDIRGRKTSMVDPDMGTWYYRYNGFGELIWQKDAKGQIVTLSYDGLGRMNSRVEPEGTTTWNYDSATRPGTSAWRGKLASVTAPGGYTETYDYDSLGRPSTTWRTVPGSAFSGTEARYFVTQTYDSAGRPSTTIYPTQFRTRNVYNQFGYLKEVRKYLASDDGKANSQLQGFIYWMADSYDSAGRVNGELYGNGLANDRFYSAATGRLRTAAIGRGTETAAPYSIQYLQYTYDQVGNVLTRTDGPTARSETFGYDGLDRLLTHTLSISGTAQATVSVTYDAQGNITSKSDAATTYTYGSSRPHAVTAVSGGALGSQSYGYDANGNMTSGGGRTITWTSFNQLLRADMTGGKFSEFAFGAGHERVKQTSNLGTTTYIGALFERFTPTGSGAITEDKHYIFTPTGRVAVVTQRSNMTSDTRWFHTDGLGSITAVTNEAGAIVKRFAFDAWGKRVTPSTNGVITTNGSTGTTASGGFTRGYTDHEQLDDLGLIHMNGRVYDPVLGRFLSADPNVDDARDAQGFNRYSYVGNNPMNATDPSGFFKLKDALKIVAIAVVAWVTAGIALQAWAAIQGGAFAGGLWGAMTSVGLAAGWSGGYAIAAGIGAGFGSGFAGSLLNGGSIGDAFKAGVIGGIVGGISAGIAGKIGDVFGGYGEYGPAGELGRGLAHGVSQGALTEAQGGEFRHGFYAGFASSVAAGPIRSAMPDSMTGRTIAAAVVGGTASALGGGKFANGAFSGAFTHLFNDEAHSWWDDAKDYASAAWQGAKQGYYAWADGLNPFGNFYADMGYYDPNDSALQWSQRFGTVSQVAGSGLLGGGGLYGGARSVFWSGGGNAARVAETLGRPIQKTLWGRVMNAAQGGLRQVFGKPAADKAMAPFWDAASSVYAMNVRGTAQAYIVRPGPVWTNVERPLLDLLGKSYRIVP